jgi:hypothetical protein
MLRLFRARACCLLTTVILAVGTTATGMSELLHAGTLHDPACVPSLDVVHDASTHRFRAAADEGGAEHHCIACHLARAPRLGSQSASGIVHVEAARPVRPIAAIGFVRAATLDNLPSRSPPRLV